jgi:hypothetical protein
MADRTGRCLCGHISYRLTAEPVISRICWCRNCQRISSNGTVNAVIKTEAIEISGTPSEHTGPADSGNQVRRRFCPRCGTHLFSDTTGRPGMTVVRLGTLDDPSSIKPTANIWTASAPTWACLDSTLERIERQPPPPQPRKPA